MKKTGIFQPRHRATAFTLIELIVVIAIIGILASLVFPIAGAIGKKKQIALAQTQLKDVQAAIDGYKTKLGYYPPDNTNSSVINPLYFELLGTFNDGTGKPAPTLWTTMDRSAKIGTTTTPTAITIFNVQSFANSSTRTTSDDSGAAAVTFMKDLKPNQYGLLDVADPNVRILACGVAWPLDRAALISGNATLNPFQYNSSHPTNNVGTYDLWVDLVIKGKTNRISNWSTQPIQL